MTSEVLEGLNDRAPYEAVLSSTEDEVNRRAAMLAPVRVGMSEPWSGEDDNQNSGWYQDARSRKAAPRAPWTPWRSGLSD